MCVCVCVQVNVGYLAVTVGADALLAMKRTEIFVCRPSSKNKRATFYRYVNMYMHVYIYIDNKLS